MTMNRFETPLPRRTTDRLRDRTSALLALVGFVVLIAGVIVGVVVHAGAYARGVTERATRSEVTAVLLAEAQRRDGDHATSALPIRAEARWTTPDGRTVTGTVPALLGTPAGTRVTVWLDADGQPVDAPGDPAGAVMIGVLAATLVLAVGGVGLAGLATLAQWLTAVSADRYWEREWTRVEPGWRYGHRADQD